ncbi:ABC transporter permease [Microbacterium sp. NPDC091313]
MTTATAPTRRTVGTADGAPRARTLGRLGWLLIQVSVFLAVGGVWWIAATVLPAGTMPPPAEVLGRLSALALTGDFWAATGLTALTFLVAFVVCVGIGVPLGLAIGASSIASQSTRLLFDFLRTIPPIAILPLLLLLFGPELQMVLILAIAGAIWPVLIQSIYAARQGEALLVEMSRAFRIPRGWFIRHIFLPGTLPFVMTGLRLGATICLLLTVSGELLGNAPGVGFEISQAQAFYDNSRMYAYVLVSAILGLIVNGLFWEVQRRVLRWHPSMRKEVAS